MTTVNNSHPVDIVIKSKDEFHQTLFNVRIPDGTTEVSNKAFAVSVSASVQPRKRTYYRNRADLENLGKERITGTGQI